MSMDINKIIPGNIQLNLSKKEAKYLSALIEAQISKYDMLGEEEMKKEKSHREAHKVFNKIGGMLVA